MTTVRQINVSLSEVKSDYHGMDVIVSIG